MSSRSFISTLLGSLVAAGTIAAPSPSDAEEHSAVQFFAPAATSTPFSPAVRVGGVLYLSGQLGLVPGTSKLAAGGVRAETRQAMQNIKTSLASHGYGMKDVVKCSVFLVDMSEFAAFNSEYLSFFSSPYPARSAIGVSALAFGGRVEIECMAAK